MSGLKRAGLIATFVAFSVAGVALAVAGDTEQRIAGIVALLFFGGGGLGWWLITGPRRRSLPGFRTTQVDVRGSTQVAFVADYDRRVALIAGVMLLGMAAAMALMLLPAADAARDGTQVVVLMGCGVFFAVMGAYSLIRARRGGRIALLRSGLLVRTPAGGIHVPWEAVGAVGDTEVHGNPFMTVSVRDPDAVEAETLQRVAQLAERSMGHDLSFSPRALLVEIAELRFAIERYRDDPEARGRIGSLDELERIRAAGAATTEAVLTDDGGRPIRELLAIGALAVVGGLVAAVSVLTALDEPTRGRLIGGVVLGLAGALQLVSAVLLARHRRIGRWVGLAGAVLLAAVFTLATAQADLEARTATAMLTAVLWAHAILVVWGTAGAATARAGKPSTR